VNRCIGVLQGYKCTAVDQLCSRISIVRVCLVTGVVQRYIVCRNNTGVQEWYRSIWVQEMYFGSIEFQR
jgi:hypothetical protein